MTRKRMTAAVAAASIWSATLAIGAPAVAGPGSEGGPVNASSELQQEYPLHEPKRCCSALTPPGAASGESARRGSAEGADGFPSAMPMLLALLGVLGLALAGRAIALRGRRRRDAAPSAAVSDEPVDAPAVWRPRPRRVVSPATIRLAWPLFRYSWHRDAYVLRSIGDRIGPVLKPRTPLEDVAKRRPSPPTAKTTLRTAGPALIRHSAGDVDKTERVGEEYMSARPESGADEVFSALRKSDRCCRLLLKELRESHPDILATPEFESLEKLARRQLRENRQLLGTGPDAVKGRRGAVKP